MMGNNTLPHTIWDGVYGDYEGFHHILNPMLEDLNKYGIDFQTWAHNCLNQDDLEDAVDHLNRNRAGHHAHIMPDGSTAVLMRFLNMAVANEPMTQAQAWIALSALPYAVDDDISEWEIMEWMLDSCPGIAWQTFRPDQYGQTSLCIWSEKDLRERYGAIDNNPFQALINLRRNNRV